MTTHEFTDDEVQGDPRLVYCTTCYSKPGEPCTQPTDDGQRKVPWHHLAREAAARQTRHTGS